ncbi:MAG: Toxin RelG [Mycoplasmataceae bacterium]|nr:MAG: Toxin RelG [Mycoplasmataceae bacterium]
MENKIYKVRWEDSSKEEFNKLDIAIRKIIYNKVGTHLIKAPNELGKPLSGNLKGFLSYRVKDVYRVIYKINEDEILIIVFLAGHRKDIYDKMKKLVLKWRS